MHTRARAALVALALVSLPAATLAGSPSPEPSPVPAPAFVGPVWFLTSYIAEDGGPAGAAASATITFDADTLTGDTGCSHLSGPWTGDSTSIAFGTLDVTRDSCDPSVTGQDAAILAALSEVSGYTVSGGELVLLDAAGHPRLTYGSIEDRTWVPIFGGDEATPQATVTLALLDGIASGQAPCNQFSAPYQLDGTSLIIWPIGTTQSTCPDQAIEGLYLSELASTRLWTIDQGDLVLVDELDAPVRRFAAGRTGD